MQISTLIRRGARAVALALLMALMAPAWAAHGTLSSDDTTASVYFPKGRGWIMFSGTFGSGTATVEVLREDQTNWEGLKDYTAAPTYAGETWDFGDVPVLVRITLASSSSPSLYWQISPGAR